MCSNFRTDPKVYPDASRSTRTSGSPLIKAKSNDVYSNLEVERWSASYRERLHARTCKRVERLSTNSASHAQYNFHRGRWPEVGKPASANFFCFSDSVASSAAFCSAARRSFSTSILFVSTCVVQCCLERQLLERHAYL